MSFEIKKDKTKWILCGTGIGWEFAPKESDAIIFGLNDLLFVEKYRIKLDYLAIMDVLDEKPQIVAGIDKIENIINRINALQIPLIAPYKYDEIPLSEAFPLEECAKEFGMLYFGNTIGYMIAYVLMKGAKEINIYGVNQASSSEYFYEKASVEYWIGMAVGRGVKVIINGDKSELLTNKSRFGGNLLYGYAQTFENIIRTKQKFGVPIIYKLIGLKQQRSRIIRKIN